VRLTEVAATAAVTLGIAAAAPVVMDLAGLQGKAETTAATATCRSIDNAISAYVAEHNEVPTLLLQVESYVRGDTSAYRIELGHAIGPGCDTAR
jgi:hypothetical protein